MSDLGVYADWAAGRLAALDRRPLPAAAGVRRQVAAEDRMAAGYLWLSSRLVPTAGIK